ncbi:MAG: response regulator transcription factor [Lachnospiraceae bacterium]|nr:response regulator transcription factor [Lachnospiraceae bacterium]
MERRLLVVEDDALMAEAVADYFSGKGWSVKTASDGMEALALFEQSSFHLVLLDVMMPGMSGFSVCRKLREKSDVPVIFITARVMEEDKLNGYTMGADDYVTKPFSLPILYAKAEALTGRVWGSDAHIQKAGSLSVNPRSHEVRVQGRPVNLPPKEYELLLFFLENPGRVYSRDQLLIRFWGYDFDGNERVVDSHIKKLRKALGDCGCAIRTVRKSGYRMEVTG